MWEQCSTPDNCWIEYLRDVAQEPRGICKNEGKSALIVSISSKLSGLILLEREVKNVAHSIQEFERFHLQLRAEPTCIC